MYTDPGSYFFTKDDDMSYHFENTISEQSNTCCSKKNIRSGSTIDGDYVNNNMHRYTHGIVILGDEKQELIGREFRNVIKAYALMIFKDEPRSDSTMEGVIRGVAICCDENHKGYGKQILDMIRDLGKDKRNNIKRWIINSLPEPSLFAFYKKVGFEHVGDKSSGGGVIKTKTMKMYFGPEEEDDYDYSVEVEDDVCFEKPNILIDTIPYLEVLTTKTKLYG